MLPPDAVAPQLCFGQVRHARLRPARNAFTYGGYYLRLPLRSLGADGFQAALCSRNRFNLLSFHDTDHGDGQQPLLAWIDALLHAEGVHDAGGEVWLQAMPRVLGFVFNPVSFWFCHGRDGALRAIVCDVRNTFGERHRYLLGGDGIIRNGALLSTRKVFHVSPFCAVEGSYRFRFTRVQRLRADDPAEQTLASIDYHDNAGLLLQTSVSGRAAALSTASAARAFFLYPLMTFNVVVRIHLQAFRLWCKRVPFFSKPAPPKQKVSR